MCVCTYIAGNTDNPKTQVVVFRSLFPLKTTRAHGEMELFQSWEKKSKMSLKNLNPEKQVTKELRIPVTQKLAGKDTYQSNWGNNIMIVKDCTPLNK